MARILCGVMGDSLGHVGEALALAQALPDHQFLFLGGGQVTRLTESGYEVQALPLLSTAYRGNRVDLAATLGQGARALLGLAPALARAERMMRRFQPHLVLSLFEVFSQLAAKRLGLPCLSLDHQHFLSHCHRLPISGQVPGQALLRLSLRATTSWAGHYLVHSFFPLSARDPRRTETFPPLLAPEVAAMVPRAGNHVLVYQTSATFSHLLPALRAWGRPCLVYGLGSRPDQANLTFCPANRQQFWRHLASCRFLVANGGHNAISEALHLGKPVLAMPIALAYEQYANACMLRHLGWGDYSLSPRPEPDLFRSFERRLDSYRQRLAGRTFNGTFQVAQRLREWLGEA